MLSHSRVWVSLSIKLIRWSFGVEKSWKPTRGKKHSGTRWHVAFWTPILGQREKALRGMGFENRPNYKLTGPIKNVQIFDIRLSTTAFVVHKYYGRFKYFWYVECDLYGNMCVYFNSFVFSIYALLIYISFWISLF